MTDSYHYQIEPEPRADGTKGTFEVHADGSVSGFLKYGGTYFHESAERLIECGHANADEYAKVLVALGYKRIDPTTIGPFGSGATLKTSGDKIVGRVEAQSTLVAGRDYSKPIEPERAPLDWNTATPFDTFGADFIVTKGAEPTSPLHTSPTTDSAYPAIAGLLRG